jgi:hypothetical protein
MAKIDGGFDDGNKLLRTLQSLADCDQSAEFRGLGFAFSDWCPCARPR